MSIADIIIIVVYFILTLWLGIYYRSKGGNARDYFLGQQGLRGVGGSILVGLSIAATLFSGISLLAYPSIFYTNGLVVLITLISFPIYWLVLRYWFLPRYLKRGGGYPYSVIEDKFGRSASLTASVLFILLRIGWMSALIYAPTLILIAAGGLSEDWFWPVVVLIGLSSTLYATIGGIRGVIVTDALQFAVMVGGVLFVVGYILIHLGQGPAEIVEGLRERGQWRFFDWSLNPTTTFTVWTLAIGSTVSGLSSYMGDQMTLQRYLASGDVKEAARSFGVNIAGAAGIVCCLALTGVLLSAWYAAHPDPNLPAEADKVYPYFLSTALPSGMMGLVLAAVLAATMSSLTSGINALAGCLTNDFLRSIQTNLSESQLLRWGRGVSILIGCIATLGAGFVSHLGNIFDIAQKLYGVFMGPLLALMLMTLSRWRPPTWSILGGAIVGCAIGIVVVWSPVASLWTATTAFLGTFIVPVAQHIMRRGLRRSSNE